MSKIFCCLAAFLVLSLPHFSSAQVGDNGSVVVNVRTTDTTNNAGQTVTRRTTQRLPFSYSITEWNSEEEIFANTEWFYEADGEDSFELYNNYGAVIDFTPPTGIDVPAVLAIVASSSGDDQQTVADTIGYSVSQAVRNTATPSAQDNSNVATAVVIPNPVDGIQNAATDAQNYIQTATQNAITNIGSAAAGAAAPAVAIDDAYRNALQNLQQSYNNAIANLSSAYNTAKANAGANVNNAVESVTTDVQQGAENLAADVANLPENAAETIQQGAENLAEDVANLPENAAQGAVDVANDAGEQIGSAVSNVSEAANNAQNAAENVQDAFNSGFNSAANGQ